MNITFGTTEMQTLNDLQEIAKKHGMNIIFGFNSNLQFTAECDSYNIDGKYYQPLEEFMSNGNYFCFSYSPTIIIGFGNKESVTDFRVYRSGMALKYFGDLVCDFLGEPRIERVY